jgi:hypothetical protein
MNVTNEVFPTDPKRIAAMQEDGPPGPILMVNLLKFRAKAQYADGRASDLSGRDAYMIYGKAVARLLPKFGGKGMYGIAVHEAVLAAGEKESGCSVHFVSEEYDEGEVLLQKRCAVLPDDTPETLADRVLDLEHTAYPEALKLLVSRL